MDKFSLSDIKKKNYSDVYKLIYNTKEISKQQIANALQMSLPTVTQHLSSLMSEGLITQGELISSGVGRKAMSYKPCANAYLALGIEILSNKVTVVLIDLFGKVINKKRVPLSFSQDDEYYDSLSLVVNTVIKDSGAEINQILGAGFGIQGMVSNNGEEIIYGKILNCTNMKIDSIKERFPFPCRFIHDAESAAELELWKDADLTDAIYLSLGQHLGGAVISNGKIMSGRTGRTGTFEHMTLTEGGLTCYCGKRGCMECYCSGEALTKGMDIDEFFEKLRNNDAKCTADWIEYLGWLALALNNLHMVLDSTIILGGHIAPYLSQEDMDMLFYLVQLRTAFPEKESFLRLGVQEKDVVAVGSAIPFIKNFLEQI